jgi:succinoglycan biosynthesis protein ExoU
LNSINNSSQPSVCIIIAAYNAETTIKRAILSALKEPEVSEVIVVDDASTDNTSIIAQSADDGSGRLKVLRQINNAGPSAARNRAIAESQSEWIGILDSDDFFVQGRIKTLLSYSSEADLIADDMWQVQENAIEGKREKLLKQDLKGPITIGFSDFVLSNITSAKRERGELGFIKPLIRRSFLDQHQIRYNESMRLGEDFELYATALGFKAKLIIIPTQGYVSVVRSNSLSGRHSENDLLNLRDSDRVLQRKLKITKSEQKALRQHYLSIDCRLQWRLLINAVKTRNLVAALATFIRPYPVPFYLCKQLLQQAMIRSFPKTIKSSHERTISI